MRTAPTVVAVDHTRSHALVGGHGAWVVELGKGQTVAKLGAGNIKGAGSLGDGKWVTWGKDGVFFWRLGGGKVKKRKKMVEGPVAVLGGVGAVDAVAVGKENDHGSRVVAAVLSEGGVAVWEWVDTVKGQQEVSFVVQAEIGAVFAVEVEGTNIKLLHGNELKPKLWEVSVDDVEDGGELELPDVIETMAKEEGGEAQKARRLEMARKSAKVSGKAVEAIAVKEKKKDLDYAVEGMEVESSTEEVPNDEEESTPKEPTIRERLLELGLSREGAKTKVGHVASNPGRNRKVLGVMWNVLAQAVKSKDSELFDRTVYSIHSEKMVRQTVQKVPSEVAVGAMLDMLVQRLRTTPKKIRILVVWIREILMEHAGALLSQRRNQALKALIEIVHERSESLNGLARLEGRLALVMTQAERLKRSVGVYHGNDRVPEMEYEEEEASDGEVDSDDSSEGEEESELDSEDCEGETRDASGDDDSSEEESDEEMEDVEQTGRRAVRGGQSGSQTMKMNGTHMSGESSESESSSDEVD